MSEPKRFRFTIADGTSIVVWGILSVWVTAGFFHPDTDLLFRFGRKFEFMLWGARTGSVALFAGILSVYLMVRSRRMQPVNAALIAGSFVFCGVAVFVVGNVLYAFKGGIREAVSAYHPYLQLTPRIPENIPAGERNVFFLGGSTTEWMRSDGIGWVKIAGERLRSMPEFADVHFHNCGRQWYTSFHTLINFEANLRRYKPDVIVVMHAINDLLNNADQSYFSHGRFRNDYGHFYGPVNRIIENRGFVGEMTSTFRIWYFKPRKTIEVFEFPGCGAFERNIATIIDLASLDGIRVVLMTQPSLLRPEMTGDERDLLRMVNVETCGETTKWSFQSAYRGMDLFNETTREIARKRGTYLIDLEKVIPKNRKFFTDEVHYTDTAHIIIAKHVADGFIVQNIVPSAGPSLP